MMDKKKNINKYLKYLVKLIVLLFLGSWLDETALMEPLNENNNEIPPLEKESWSDWYFKHEGKILITSSIIIILSLIFINMNIDPNTLEKIPPFLDAPVSPIDLILSSLEPITMNLFFNDFLTTVTDIVDKKISKEEGITVLLKMIKWKSNSALVFDEKKFQEITETLIEEIEKL